MHDIPRSRFLACIAGALALHGVGVITSTLFSGRSAREVVLQTVDLTAASSQAEGWNKVGAIMAAAIKRKPPRVPASRRGVRIGIELVAEERWPSGALARGEAPKLEIKLPNIKTTDEAKEELAKRNPLAVPPPGDPGGMPPLKANVELPGVFLKGRGKVCAYNLGVTPFGIGFSGACDPSNVGANPTRVVSARVIGQTML